MPLLCFSGLNFDQGGGFYGGDTQGGQNTPSTGDKRRQRAQNLVPVKIGDIVDNREETFKVEIWVLCRFVNNTFRQFDILSNTSSQFQVTKYLSSPCPPPTIY